MPLRASIATPRAAVASGDVSVEVQIVNDGPAPEPFHRYQARHAPLVLEVEDENGTRVLLPPPAPPDDDDLAPPGELAPGESVTIGYSGFLDSRRASGRYRVRWFSPHRALGALPQAPLVTEWAVLDVGRQPGGPPPPPPGSEVLSIIRGWWRWLTTVIVTIPLRLLCRAVLTREVDVPITETITDGIPEAWNGTYGWNARFHVEVNQASRQVRCTVRLRLSGVGSSTATTWAALIQSLWSGRFKSCVVPRCGSDGFPLIVSMQVVTSGEHHTVTLAPGSTAHMLSWGAADSDQAHEFGHMLGNKEEYFTIDGIPFGAPRRPDGNIMNNPVNPPVARHYALIQQAVDELLGTTASVKGVKDVNVPC